MLSELEAAEIRWDLLKLAGITHPDWDVPHQRWTLSETWTPCFFVLHDKPAERIYVGTVEGRQGLYDIECQMIWLHPYPYDAVFDRRIVFVGIPDPRGEPRDEESQLRNYVEKMMPCALNPAKVEAKIIELTRIP